jgi:hypothetical protein
VERHTTIIIARARSVSFLLVHAKRQTRKYYNNNTKKIIYTKITAIGFRYVYTAANVLYYYYYTPGIVS